jgi:hypothetical protein
MNANVRFTSVDEFLGSLSLGLQFFGCVIFPLGFVDGCRNVIQPLDGRDQYIILSGEVDLYLVHSKFALL